MYEYDCGDCSATCGLAVKTCNVHVIQEARYGGNECPYPAGLTESVPCDGLEKCPLPFALQHAPSGLPVIRCIG